MTSLTNALSKVFGSGDVFALVSGLTPVKIGVLQDIEFDIASAVAELYGQYQSPVAIGRGKTKLTGKAKTGEFNINLFNSLYYGGSVTVGSYEKQVSNEVGSAGASAPSMTPAISSLATVDLGLYYSATGVQLSYSTSSAPTIGNYAKGSSVGAPYLVSTAETAATGFYLNYEYVSPSGNQLVVTNQLMGIQPVFELHLYEGYTDFGGRTNFNLKLNRCISTKLNFPFKNSDFMISDFEFECFADSTGGLYTLGTGT